MCGSAHGQAFLIEVVSDNCHLDAGRLDRGSLPEGNRALERFREDATGTETALST